MKTDNRFPGQILRRMNPALTRPVISGISAAAVVLLGGCTTHPPAGVTCGDLKPLAEPLRLQLGTVALVSPSNSAEVRFDKAIGRIETFGDRAGVTAGTILDPSGLSSDPLVQSMVGVVGFFVAPAVAVASGGSAARARLTPGQLSECESNLLSAMKMMAAQKRFQDWLVKTANEKTRRRLIPLDPAQFSAASQPLPETVLETQVQELRLERTGKGDSSYALRIKAKARLLRTADRAVLFERPFEFRSATCLFLDWTLSDSFQRVAETGYRDLADRLVDQLFVATPEGPLLAGAGYKQPPNRQDNGAVELVASREIVRRPAAQFVNYPLVNTGSIGIYSTATVSRVTLQHPLTKDQAASEAVKDMEWTFDGLYNHPNLMISLPTIAVAIPVGLWKQGVAVGRGLTDRQFRQAHAQLSAAVRDTRPHEELAVQVAQRLAPQTSQSVMLVKKPLPPGAEEECAVMQCVARGTLAWLPKGQSVTGYLVEQGADTALEIHVVSAALAAKRGVNPPLALCVEAEVRLLRARDGEEIYSCPVRYRSQERKFTQWAAHDARLFRQELQNCYREMGATIVNQLVSRRLINPDSVAFPTLVKN